MDSYRYVSETSQLHELAELITAAKRFGVDTEADSFYSYRERVCLVQVTPEGQGDWIIDPLVEDLDMGVLTEVFADPEIEVIMHGADYDIVSMKRDFGYEFTGVFDTMIAAQMCGYERFGLADLVKNSFGVKLDKKYQRFDWGRRPLPPEALDYARLDSHFLSELRHELWEGAAKTGRHDALREEFGLLEKRSWSSRANDPGAFLKIKGAGDLDDTGNRVLRALYEAREEFSAELDRPPFKVLPQSFLLDLARKPTTDSYGIRKIAGHHARMAQRFSRRIAAAVEAGLADERPIPPKPQQRTGPRLWPKEERRFLKLKAWRNKRAAEQGFGPSLVMSNTSLKGVAVAIPVTREQLNAVDELRDWQRDEYGDELMALVAKLLEAEKNAVEEPKPSRRRRRRGRSGGDSGGGSERVEGAAPAPAVKQD